MGKCSHFFDWSLITLKVSVNEETLLQKHFELMLLTMFYGCANGKEAKYFCFRDTNSASSRYVAWLKSVKSVQSALSDLKRPPERLQSHCNYQPFIN